MIMPRLTEITYLPVATLINVAEAGHMVRHTTLQLASIASLGICTEINETLNHADSGEQLLSSIFESIVRIASPSFTPQKREYAERPLSERLLDNCTSLARSTSFDGRHIEARLAFAILGIATPFIQALHIATAITGIVLTALTLGQYDPILQATYHALRIDLPNNLLTAIRGAINPLQFTPTAPTPGTSRIGSTLLLPSRLILNVAHIEGYILSLIYKVVSVATLGLSKDINNLATNDLGQHRVFTELYTTIVKVFNPNFQPNNPKMDTSATGFTGQVNDVLKLGLKLIIAIAVAILGTIATIITWGQQDFINQTTYRAFFFLSELPMFPVIAARKLINI